jgi:hypothetical protein
MSGVTEFLCTEQWDMFYQAKVKSFARVTSMTPVENLMTRLVRHTRLYATDFACTPPWYRMMALTLDIKVGSRK